MNMPDPYFPLQLTKNNKTPYAFCPVLNSATVIRTSVGKGKRQRDVRDDVTPGCSETHSVLADLKFADNLLYLYKTKTLLR
jgi:hypothetical protein